MHVGQRLAVPRAARDGQRNAVFALRLVVAQVDIVVLGKMRVQDDVEQPREKSAPNRRHTGHGFRLEHAMPDDAQMPCPFGDEHGTAGQEREAPGMRQPSRDDDDPNVLPLGGVKGDGMIGQRRNLEPLGRDGDAVPERDVLLGGQRQRKTERAKRGEFQNQTHVSSPVNDN